MRNPKILLITSYNKKYHRQALPYQLKEIQNIKRNKNNHLIKKNGKMEKTQKIFNTQKLYRPRNKTFKCLFRKIYIIYRGVHLIRENQRYFNLMLVVMDMAVITLSLVIAWYVRFQTSLFGELGRSGWGFANYMLLLVVILPMYFLLYYTFSLYRPKRTDTLISEIGDIIKANVTGLIVLTTLLYVFELTDYSRFMLATFAIFATISSIVERVAFRQSIRMMRTQGFNNKNILVIGAGTLGLKFALRIMENPYVGYHIIGFLDDNIEKGQKILDSSILGKIKDLEHYILENPVDMVVVTLSTEHHNLMDIVDVCEKHGVKAEIVPDFSRYFPAKPYIDMIDDIPIIDIRYVPLDNTYKKVLKRITDLIFASLAIIILAPVMLFTAVMVKLSSPGPVIYKQERVGFNKENFMIYKFRSMKVQDESDENLHWTTEEDPRRTKFGSFIRKTSIDEFPQFFNVLRGDMSLIGPRPERPAFVEKFKEEIPKYMIKHYVRPGMSGWAQVNGYRGNTSIKKRVEYDIYYVENWTLLLDLQIFFLTFIRGFINKNAY